MKRVLILGAGFAGLSTALELSKLRERRLFQGMDVDVTIIDRNDFQLFTPDLYEIAAAIKPETTAQELKNAVCLDVSLSLAQKKINFVQSEIHEIDTEKQVVCARSDGQEVCDYEYDVLVMCLGSEAFYFGIDGMKEHSVALKKIDEAALIRNEIFDLVEKDGADHVIVCGGGPAGVELAAELTMSCRTQMEEGTFAVTMVEAQPTVLAPFGQRAAGLAMKRLEKLGVNLKTNFMIAKAEEGKITSSEGDVLEGDLIVWTGGVKANHLLEQCGIELTKRGQLEVTESFETKRPGVFALGDCAQVPKQSRNLEPAFCAQTAHEAVSQAPIAALNILNYLAEKPMKQYRPSQLADAAVIAMGGKHAIVKLPMGIVFSHYIGWLMRKWIDFQHFRSVLPFMHACSVWYGGLKTMAKNEKR